MQIEKGAKLLKGRSAPSVTPSAPTTIPNFSATVNHLEAPSIPVPSTPYSPSPPSYPPPSVLVGSYSPRLPDVHLATPLGHPLSSSEYYTAFLEDSLSTLPMTPMDPPKIRTVHSTLNSQSLVQWDRTEEMASHRHYASTSGSSSSSSLFAPTTPSCWHSTIWSSESSPISYCYTPDPYSNLADDVERLDLNEDSDCDIEAYFNFQHCSDEELEGLGLELDA